MVQKFMILTILMILCSHAYAEGIPHDTTTQKSITIKSEKINPTTSYDTYNRDKEGEDVADEGNDSYVEIKDLRPPALPEIEKEDSFPLLKRFISGFSFKVSVTEGIGGDSNVESILSKHLSGMSTEFRYRLEFVASNGSIQEKMRVNNQIKALSENADKPLSKKLCDRVRERSLNASLIRKMLMEKAETLEILKAIK